jgi:hypothetical protein
VALVVRGSGCQILGVQVARGRRGVNHVRFSGRLHGRPLAAGRYSITIEVVRGVSRTRIARIVVAIVPPGRRLTRAQRNAPLTLACGRRPGLELAALVAGTIPGSGSLAGVNATPSPRSSAPFKPPSRDDLLGAGAPPGLPVPGADGSLGWLAVLLIALLGVAGAGLVLYTLRFMKGSWNP